MTGYYIQDPDGNWNDWYDPEQEMRERDYDTTPEERHDLTHPPAHWSGPKCKPHKVVYKSRGGPFMYFTCAKCNYWRAERVC